MGASFKSFALAESFKKILIKKLPPIKVQSFLSNGVWRINECSETGNFQAFSFKNKTPLVEVGYGQIGDGEKLDIINASIKNNILQIETQVCAPIGCNHTFEQYKILNKNKIMEWVFEGHLDNEPPNIVVKNGIDKEGNKGRILVRCTK